MGLIIGPSAWGVCIADPISVHIQQFGGGNGVVIELPDDRVLIGIARRPRAVLWGVGRNRGQHHIAIRCGQLVCRFSRGFVNEELVIKTGILPHDGVNVVPHIRHIAGILIIFPNILNQPCNGRRRPAPVKTPAGSGIAVGSGLGMGHEAVFRVCCSALDPRVDLCCDPARLPQALHKPHQRIAALRQIGDVGGPVVHLEIDVGVIVGHPRGIVAVVPNALEVGRQNGILPGTRNGKVAAILEDHDLQQPLLPCCGRAVLIGHDQFICGLFRRCLTHIQAHAVIEAAIICKVVRLYAAIPLLRGIIHQLLYAGSQSSICFATAVGWVDLGVVRGSGKIQGNLRTGDGDTVTACAHSGVHTGHRFEIGGKLLLVVRQLTAEF